MMLQISIKEVRLFIIEQKRGANKVSYRVDEVKAGSKKKIPSTSGQSLSCLYHESFSFSLANNKKLLFCTYPRVLPFSFSFIEEISKVVY